MLLRITSDNPNLLSLLNKNPNSDNGLYLGSYKTGAVIGACMGLNEYHAFFHDDGEYSFGDGEKMDYLWGCTPYSFIVIMNTIFSDLIRKPGSTKDKVITWLGNKTFAELDSFETKIEMNNILIDSSWYRDGEFLLSRYIDGIELVPGDEKLHKIIITKSTLLQAFYTTLIVALMLEVTNRTNTLEFDESFARKYIQILGLVDDVPYFMFYLYSKRVLSNFMGKVGDSLIKELTTTAENTLGVKCRMTLFGTHMDRLNFIKPLIDCETALINYGCEGFFYEKKFRSFSAPWISYDVVDMSEHHQKIIDSGYKGIVDDWTFTTDLNTVDKDKVYQVLMSEVIEHNTKESFLVELNQLISEFKVKRIILTTPNKGFNKYYFDNPDDVRREDHLHEYETNELKEYITDWLDGTNEETRVQYVQVGDIVDGEAVTNGVIIDFLKYATNDETK